MKRHIAVYFVSIIVFFICAYVVQYSHTGLYGADAYIHGRMSEMIGKQGLLRAFPQVRYSLFKERFVDRDVLYHLYLLPFVRRFGYIAGVKFAAFLGTVLAFVIIGWVLFQYSSVVTYVFLCIFLFLSSQVLLVYSLARPFVFAVPLLVLGIYVFDQKKYFLLALVSFIYGSIHISAWTLPVIILCISFARVFSGNSEKIWPSSIAFASYVASFFVNPYFPDNIYYSYLVGVKIPFSILFHAGRMETLEFLPFTTRDFFMHYPMVIVVVLILYAAHLTVRVRYSRRMQIWLVASAFFVVFGVISRKNLLMFYPVLLVWFATILQNYGMNMYKKIRASGSIITGIFWAGIAVFFVYGVYVTRGNMKQTLSYSRIMNSHYLNVVSVFKQYADEGEHIYHADWSDSQILIGLAPEFQYIVTLDPVYFQEYDERLYSVYQAVKQGVMDSPYDVIVNALDSRFGYVSTKWPGLVEQIKKEHRFEIVYEDPLGIVFIIKGA